MSEFDYVKKALSATPTTVDVSRSTKREPKRWAVIIYDELTVYYVKFFWTKRGAWDGSVDALEDVLRVKNA